jgi:hypothetical protein
MGEKRNAYTTFVRKPEGKRQIGRKVENKMDFREMGWDDMGWIDRAEDRDQWRALLNTVMNLQVP